MVTWLPAPSYGPSGVTARAGVAVAVACEHGRGGWTWGVYVDPPHAIDLYPVRGGFGFDTPRDVALAAAETALWETIGEAAP